MTDFSKKISELNAFAETLKQAFQPYASMPQQGEAWTPAAMAQHMEHSRYGPCGCGSTARYGPCCCYGSAARWRTPAAPSGDPAQMEAMMSEIMSAVEQVAAAIEQQGKVVEQLKQQAQQSQSENMQLASRLDMLEKAIKILLLL